MDSFCKLLYNGVYHNNFIQGVSKMSHYTHFTTEEREKSMVLLGQGQSIRAIARILCRAPSTVCRELKRNANKDGNYSASAATRRYENRRKLCHKKAILSGESELRSYVIEKLKEDWSPDQISGRAKEEQKAFSISYNTIYRAIQKGLIPKELRSHLRIKSTKNRKKRTSDKRGKIADTVSIHDRPAEAETREVLGHWESDTILGRRKTGCIGTHVERKTGFLIAFKLPDRKDDVFTKTTIKYFLSLPNELKKSFTVDNGVEFMSHKQLAQETGMNVYFCDPYSPWQRGTNENTNCLLRQYYPKGTSFFDMTDEELDFYVQKINNRPRKRFGYKTPFEVLRSSLELCCT